MNEEALQKTALHDLKSLNKEELRALCLGLGMKKFRSDQIFQWLYQKGAVTFEEMTNLPKDLRQKLSEVAYIRSLTLHQKQTSKDGTTKYLYNLHDGNQVEAVLIPEFFDDGVADRLTVCVSSQVGCVFGCAFCATGKMGFFRNLSPGEIVDQITTINLDALERFGKRITNIVYMGMGEPLHNYQAVMTSTEILTDPLSLDLSPKRITVSTVGLTKQIKQIGDEKRDFNLAISLHAASDDKRDQIMPINDSLDLHALKDALQYYNRLTGKPVTFEYLLFDGFNDNPEDARNLAAITRWLPSKVNIIMYNNVLGVALQRAREDRLNAFMKQLSAQRVRATVRRSRGDDIDAGCGQLAIREGQARGKTIAKA
ncbi:MAG: 23S rRNA (adenine(2503)-C(2))-methyltransferase RlmN [Balneolales bacterium]|nr:23S rRNA (adenine(2503)-C(2))-methyltransferase RlmN [Balneolales bacterium]